MFQAVMADDKIERAGGKGQETAVGTNRVQALASRRGKDHVDANNIQWPKSTVIEAAIAATKVEDSVRRREIFQPMVKNFQKTAFRARPH